MAELRTLSEALNEQLYERRSYVTLTKLDSKDEIKGVSWADANIYDGGMNTLRFQYFPESISDSKSVSWTPKEFPGGSLPVYQWNSSGERTVSFSAVFTTDLDQTDSLNEEVLADKKDLSIAERSPDIRVVVAWLRGAMLPDYVGGGSTSGQITQAPSKLILSVPGSGLGIAGGNFPPLGDADSIVCVMTECSVEWSAFFPSGVPRAATVSLAFAQVPQYRGNIYFPRRDQTLDMMLQGDSLSPSRYPFRPYTLKPDR